MFTALRVLEKVSPVSSEDLIGVAITAYSSCLMPSSGFVYVCKIEDEVGIRVEGLEIPGTSKFLGVNVGGDGSKMSARNLDDVLRRSKGITNSECQLGAQSDFGGEAPNTDGEDTLVETSWKLWMQRFDLHLTSIAVGKVEVPIISLRNKTSG